MPDALVLFLKKYERFYIAAHLEPDGDCIGSALAISRFLRRIGKKTVLLTDGPFIRTEIERYKNRFKTSLNRDDLRFDGSEGSVILDCSTPERIGSMAESIEGLPAAVIDHHSSGKPFGDVRYIVPGAPSTTYLIQKIIEKMDGPVHREEAVYLLFGLLTDTGYFRHLSEGTGEVFRQVGRLVDAGANPHEVHHMIYGGKSFDSRKLLGRLLDRAEPYYGGQLIVTWETAEDTAGIDKNSRDSDTLYQLIFSIKGCKAAALLRQEGDSEISCSLRSREPIDVGQMAAEFGGGGHKLASGFTVGNTEIPELKEKVVARFNQVM
ncbi:MAG: DHH family phosphoesterase [Spirochaetia bacterium]